MDLGKAILLDKQKINVKEDDGLFWGPEGRNSEFKLFDLSQVSGATSNFSSENKLGQGGFGPVYKVKNHVSTYRRRENSLLMTMFNTTFAFYKSDFDFTQKVGLRKNGFYSKC
jgi:hypothetical protein